MIQLSVVIPSYNRAAQLQACLQALAAQTLSPSTFEVVVVVDGSTDDTRARLAALTLPYPLRIVWQANAGQCAALNRGAAEATGPVIVFLDNDVLPGPGLLEAHAQALQGQATHVGIGRLTMQPPASSSGFTRSFARMWNQHYDRLNEGVRAPGWRDCYSGNLSVPRELWLAAGGFAPDISAGFDIELGYRLEQHGARFVYVHGAVGEHNDYKNFARLAADDEHHGRASLEICRRHPAMRPRLLGGFGETTARALLLRRVLLALRVPARVLAWLSPLTDGRPWADEWYKFLYSYFYWRGVQQAVPDQATWQRLTYRLPILMYHAFGGDDEPASRFVLPRRKFARQMAWLKLAGYHVISLEAYVTAHQAHELPPARAVVITIDDGFADVLTQAVPVLQRHDYPATVFIVSARVGDADQWDTGAALAGRPLLDWPDLTRWRDSRLTLGAHTRTHPQLSTLPAAAAQAEISGSRLDLETHLGEPCRLFAYPFGDYDEATLALVEQAGFAAACSVHRGLNSLTTPIFALRRQEVRGTDSLLRFIAGLIVGDDQLPRRRQAQP